MESNLQKLKDEDIKQLFNAYVEKMQDVERHTKKACQEVERFDAYCNKMFPNDIKLQNEAYEKMMDVAVEFEEGGFVAGFKTALAMINFL